jgi:hypothetical protein
MVVSMFVLAFVCVCPYATHATRRLYVSTCAWLCPCKRMYPCYLYTGARRQRGRFTCISSSSSTRARGGLHNGSTGGHGKLHHWLLPAAPRTRLYMLLLRFSCPFAFEGISPRVDQNDLCGEGLCRKKLQESIDRGFFYVFANKVP